MQWGSVVRLGSETEALNQREDSRCMLEEKPSLHCGFGAMWENKFSYGCAPGSGGWPRRAGGVGDELQNAWVLVGSAKGMEGPVGGFCSLKKM